MTECGWTRKRARVDLTTGETGPDPLDLNILRRWIGGRGLNAHTIYSETQPGVDPYGPENRLCFAVGPLSGTAAPCSGWFNAAAYSPMFHPPTYGEINIGGHWGPELKFAGYDQLIITGRAKNPVYLWIDDGHTEIRDGRPLWGKNTRETTLMIQEELGDRGVQVLCIGPAGERVVRYASLVNSFSWIGERLGLGAVMGSKNLKAVAVRGSRPVHIAEPEKFLDACSAARRKIALDPFIQKLANEGTLFLLDGANRIGLGAFKNGRAGYTPELEERLSPAGYARKYLHGREGCFSCPIHCGRYTYLRQGPFAGTHFGGPHIEAVLALGPRIGVLGWDYTLKMIETCQLSGLDALSTGAAISWAMECFEDGLLSDGDTGGISLRWGDAKEAMGLIDLIAHRRGFGDLLAEGSLRAATEIGGESKERVPHVKGLEEIGIDPRIAAGSGLSYAVSTGDWDYLKSMAGLEYPRVMGFYADLFEAQFARDPFPITDFKGTPELVIWSEENKALADLLGLCPIPNARFLSLGVRDLMEQFTAGLGIELNERDLKEIAMRTITLERILMARDGYGRLEDTHIDPYFREGVKAGPYRGARLERNEWERALSEYYGRRGWDIETGIPSGKTLVGLGLDEALHDSSKAIEAYGKKMRANGERT
jgi:aldehyde:ferredoxin oxidoreductase